MSDLIPVVTPVGELHYVNISGKGKLNYNEDGYNYVATINLSGDKAEILKDKIDEVLGEVVKGENLRSKSYRELLKDDEGVYTPTNSTADRDKGAEKTGIFAFTFTTNVAFSEGGTKTIITYNSANPPSKIELGEKKIGNGSMGAISGKLRRYNKGRDVGVSLFLNAIQIVNLIEYVGDAGFEAQEGGFTGNTEEFGQEAEPEVVVPEKTKSKLKL